MQLRSLLRLFPLGALLAACSVSSEAVVDDNESSDALVSKADKGLVGSYRIDAPNSPIRGLVVKHPSRNYTFEKKIVFALDVEPSAFPGLCPTNAPAGAICSDARIEGTLTAKGTTVTLAASGVNPLVQGLLGSYRFTRSSTALELTKLGAPTTVYTFANASYCTSEYDCNIVTPDSMCHVQYECSARRACRVTESDPSCDTSFVSVNDLSDIGGAWTARGATASSARYQSLVLTVSNHTDNTAEGTFVGSSPGTPDETGQFSSMPENAAIGFASIMLGSNGTPDVLIVRGVKLDAHRKVQAMTVMQPPATGAGPGTSWVYERQP